MVNPNLTNCRTRKVSNRSGYRAVCNANLLLLHQLRVWAVIDHIRAKDRRGQRAVDLFGVDVLEFTIQDEVVSLGTQADGSLLSQQNESKDIAVGLATLEEEFVGVDTVSDGVSDERNPVKHYGRIAALSSDREELAEDIEQYGGRKEGSESKKYNQPGWLPVEARRDRVRYGG